MFYETHRIQRLPWQSGKSIRILTESEADCYLFCGDGIRDAESAADLLDKRLIAVLGNCDRGETG